MLKKRIMGIDPGTAITGYGIIECEGNKSVVVDYGCIRIPSQLATHVRYHIIFDSIKKLIRCYQPIISVIELPFVNKNPKSALTIGMASSAAQIAACECQIEVFQYNNKTAKMAVTGRGNATKPQVQYMVQQRLGLSEPPPLDASDALALALCHAHRMK